MSPIVTTTMTTAVRLSPALRTKVLHELRAYAELSAQRAVLKMALAKSLSNIERLFTEAGEGVALDQGCAVDDFKLKMVTSVARSLDRRLLIEMGITPEMLDEATLLKPKRPYLKISVPGANDEETS